MTQKQLEVMAINRTRRLAILNCDCELPITDWFDSHGNNCEPEDAIVCVCGDDDHGWFTIELEYFTSVTVH